MHADLIVVVSQNLKDSLIAEGVDASKILVNPNGVSLQKFNEQVNGINIRQKYNLQKHKVIGFIGTFGEWHGVVEMAKAILMFFDTHADEISKVKFLLIGDGNLLESVRTIINQSSYRDTVIFTGKINQNESPQYLAACDILLSPHIGNPDGSKFFGSPTKLFEYMAMRKPIIASNLEQIGDILTHNKSALLVPPGDVAALANAIFYLLKNETLQQTLALGAYNKVIDNYTWDMHVSKILEAAGGVIKN
jgi:glycosyltransferase involved in cell wall biosynthesis